MSKRLALENIGELQQGLVTAVVDSAIKRALDDIYQRPFLDAKRKVTIELILVPLPGPSGELIGVDAGVQVKDSIPPQKTYGEILRVSVTPDKDGRGVITAYLNEPQQPLFNQGNDQDAAGKSN
jgi:hypothetical protein